MPLTLHCLEIKDCTKQVQTNINENPPTTLANNEHQKQSIMLKVPKKQKPFHKSPNAYLK